MAVNLAGVRKADLTRGDTIAKPGSVKVSLMLDHQDLDAPSPVLERSAGRPKEEVPAPSGASLGLMDPESAVARCYARFLGMELPDPRK